MNLLLSIACGVSIAIIAYLNIKQREINSAMWSMVFALLIVRTFFSTVIMPELNGLNDRAHYRNTIAKMIEKSEGKPVVLTGPATYTYPKISLLGNVYYSDTISYPSEVTFKVPYYYAHYTGEIMQYQTTPKSKELNYLMYESYLDRYPQKKRELFKFYNHYNKKTLVLFAVDD